MNSTVTPGRSIATSFDAPSIVDPFLATITLAILKLYPSEI
jgi:hypothetical protein